MIQIFFLVFVFGLNVAMLNGQYTGCDYFQTVNSGQTVSIFSPGYFEGKNYSPGATCRWQASSPPGTILYLNCIDVQLPSSQNCQIDRIAVSLTGSPTLNDATSYCGYGNFGRYSTTNRITVALLTNLRSPTGKFRCDLTVQQQCTCGQRKMTKIVGGVETLVNEFPMMAGIVVYDTRIIECGATIVSDFYAITAAHCVPKDTGYALLTGEHNYTTGTDTPYAKLYNVSNVIRNANYSSETGQNDIALVKTVLKIEFNIAVGPVCLPFKYVGMTFAGSVVTAAGWGTTKFAGPRPTALLKVILNVITNQQCVAKFPEVTNKQICTYTKDKDTCQFDSGGPLYYSGDNSLLYLIGCVNYGQACATDFPAVNLRITEYLNWIAANTPGVVYCNI